jgi:predicted ATPase
MSVMGKAAAVPRIEADEPSDRHEPRLNRACATTGSTLEEKYMLLAEAPRAVLRRLSVFAGEFSLEDAIAVVVYRSLQRIDLESGMAALQESSLLEARDEGAPARYRLTRQTRAFAFTQLVSEGEWELAVRRHAQYLLNLFEFAEVELDRGVASQWMASYGRLIDEVRAALDWAFSPSGDPSIGIGLTVAALPLWILCSRPDELCRRIELALTSEAAAGQSPRESQLRLAARLAGMGRLLPSSNT